jgi:hypothetical protein
MENPGRLSRDGIRRRGKTSVLAAGMLLFRATT